MPLGLEITSRNAAMVGGSMPTLFRSSDTTLRSRIRNTTLSPNSVGRDAHPQVDRVTTHRQFNTAVLRQATFGNIQVRHDLDARGDGERQVTRRRHHFVQHAVRLDANAKFVFKGLEMHVAGMVLDGQQQHHIQQLADRRTVGQRFGTCQIDRTVHGKGRRPA